MEHIIVISSSSDSSEFVEANDDNYPNQSYEGSDDSVGLSLSTESDWGSFLSGPSVTSDTESGSVGLASSNSTAYCQCALEDLLVECLSCGSFFELGTYCPGC
jgi:ABC-type taurine transport system substrate-binding protein